MTSDSQHYEIPQSRGMPLAVQIFFVIGVAIAVFMGAISAFNSREFHVWPASNSASVQLNGSFP